MSVVKRRVELILTCLLGLPFVHGCGGSASTCRGTDEPYTRADSNEPLRVPEGLSRPEAAGGMAIPAAKPNDQESVARAGCLDEPPSYFRSAGNVARTPEEVVAIWAQAWSAREADAVIALYSTTFKSPTDTMSSKEWLEQRREQIATGPIPDRMIQKLRITPEGTDGRIASFVQRFGANAVRKELVLAREAGSWRITEEKVSEVK